MKFKELTESSHKCPHCGGPIFSEMMMMEKKDACYYKVKAGAKVWPSAYASGRLVQCRKKGAANYGNKSEGKINEFAPPGGDDRGPNDEEILRRLAAQWWSGTEQQMIKAQQTLEALGWEIGPDESGNDDAGVYVYRIGDNDGRDTLAFGHGELSLDEGVAKDDNSDVADISDSDYMRIKGIVDKKYPGYELASLNIGRDGYIEIEIYNYKTHDTKHLKTKSTSENKQGVAKDDNSEVTDISDSDYMRIKGIVDKKYPGYELSSLNIGPNGHIEIEIYNYKTHDTKHLKTKSTSENKQGVAEEYNAEYDDEAGMADNNLETLDRAVEGIDRLIDSGDNLPEWCQEKIAVAKSMLVAVWDYMYSEESSDEVDPEVDEMFEAMDELAEEMAIKNRVSKDLVWEQFEAMDDRVLYETAAWRRKEGKSKKGGLNAKGVASYRRENPGSKLQMAVTTKPSKLKPGSKAAKRRKSFCARMSGVKGPMKKPNGKPTRKALALRKWNC